MTFVGRAAELAVLERAIADAAAGRGGLVLVTGEPGIGKTAVCEQATERAAAAGARVLWGRCPEGAAAPPFWPWAQVLRAWAAGLDPEQVKAAAGAEAMALALVSPTLASVLDSDAAVTMDPVQLLDDVATFLRRVSSDVPVVVVIDDLHWADQSTAHLLSHMAADRGTGRLLVIGTMRNATDRQAPISGVLGSVSRRATTIALAGLGIDEVAALARARHGMDLGPEAAAVMTERTDGNPFFADQMLQLAAASRRDVASLQVPPGVEEFLRERLARLDAGALALLEVASVLGREFDPATVAVIEGATSGFAEQLGSVVDAALVEEVRPGRLRFVHALVREVTYAGIRAGRRAELHRRAVAALQEGTTTSITVAAIAHHALAARMAEAPDHALRAARQALRATANADAEHLARQGLACDADDEVRRRLLLVLGEAQFNLDRFDESTATFLAAADLAEEAGDGPGMAAALLAIGAGRLLGLSPLLAPRLQDCLRLLGDDARHLATRADVLGRLADHLEDRGRAEVVCREAMDLARRSGRPEAVLLALGRFLLNVPYGEPLTVRRRLVDEMLEARRQDPAGPHAMDALAFDLRVLLEEGYVDAAAPLLAQLGELDVFSKGSVNLRMVEPVAGGMHLLRGELDRVLEMDEQLLAVAAARGAPANQGVASVSQVHGLMMMRERGEVENVVAVLEAVRQMAPPGMPAAQLDLVTALALAEDGRHDQAVHLIDEILERDLAALSRSWGGVGMALIALLVEACAHTGHRRGAEALAPLVAPLVDCNVVLGMPPMLMYGWGSAYAGLCAMLLGEFDRAQELLAEALRRNVTMRARPASARVRYHLARLAVAQEDGHAALAHATAAQQTAEQLGITVYARLAAELVAQLGGATPPPVDGVLTFVFTDIEGSTARTASAGDEAWATQLAAHASRTRALAAKHDGLVVKNLGDGFMLVFRSPQAAVAFAVALQAGEDAVPIRIGMHTGEAESTEGDYVGHHVNLAARVAGAAAAGEILVSDVVRNLLGPKGTTFTATRTVDLKGIPGQQTVHAVEQ